MAEAALAAATTAKASAEGCRVDVEENDETDDEAAADDDDGDDANGNEEEAGWFSRPEP
jgi:hypothetical protein